MTVLLPLRPLAGGEGRGEVGASHTPHTPADHLTLPRLRGSLPLPRKAAERGRRFATARSHYPSSSGVEAIGVEVAQDGEFVGARRVGRRQLGAEQQLETGIGLDLGDADTGMEGQQDHAL